jgi:hypothetical protein
MIGRCIATVLNTAATVTLLIDSRGDGFSRQLTETSWQFIKNAANVLSQIYSHIV